jgi:hypothetical protein
MKPQEQIQKVSELMAVLDQKLDEAYVIVRQAEELGAFVPLAVLDGKEKASQWWAFKCEQVLKRLERQDLITSALSKLTKAEREALKV